MSHTTYEKAKYVVDAARKDKRTFGPMLAKMDRTGKVDNAYNTIRQIQSRQAAIAAAKTLSVPEIIEADFRTGLDDIADESVSLIFTDPMFHKSSLSLYRDLARHAARVLRPGGSLVAYTPTFALPRILSDLGKHLDYHWTLVIRFTSGKTELLPCYGVLVRWRAMVWFTKGKRNPKTPVTDLISSPPPDRTMHDWAKSDIEAAYLIDKLTAPGELVLDPMCGSATTGVAAMRLGRRFLGFEIDPQRAAVARKVLHDAR
jgi:DNA methylase/Methyltransferase domain